MAPDTTHASQQQDGARRSFLRRHRWMVWTAGSALAVLLALSAVLAVLARHMEPFLRARLVAGLSARFHARVELDQFHVSVHHGKAAQWGMWATGSGLRIWRPQDGQDATGTPLIQLQEFSFHVPLRSQQAQTLHIPEVRLSGLDVHIPPHGQQERAGSSAGPEMHPEATAEAATFAIVHIDRILCQNAKLVFESSNPQKPPRTYLIAQVVLTHVVPGTSMHFVADLTNPSPRGSVHATGDFGPWNNADPGATPMRGTYAFQDADLSTIKDIEGTLSSTGQFDGELGALRVDGQANVPDFRLMHFGNALPLAATFDARVNGTNGDTWLDHVDATLGSAHFTTSGQILRVLVPNSDTLNHAGHVIDLKVAIHRTPVDSFLRLIAHAPNPVLTGEVSSTDTLHIAPGPEPVNRRVQIDGSFQLEDVRFTEAKVQQKVEDLSLRGQGHPGEVKSTDPNSVVSEMQGDIHLAHAVITLPNLDYTVPGVDIRLHGTYSLHGDVRFDGTARMQATISKMVGGWKGFLLKPADRIFKKDGAGTLIPIRIRGTRQSPEFGIDFGRIGHTEPQRPGQP